MAVSLFNLYIELYNIVSGYNKMLPNHRPGQLKGLVFRLLTSNLFTLCVRYAHPAPITAPAATSEG